MKKRVLSALFLTSLMAGGAHAQVSDDVVKIGVLNDRTSVYEDLSGDRGVEIVRMAIEDFGGTVLGKKIELVDAGHENKMDLASSLVRKWIDTEQVDAIVDIMGSGVALAINEIARDSNRIMIAASAATSALTANPVRRIPSSFPTTPMHWRKAQGARSSSRARSSGFSSPPTMPSGMRSKRTLPVSSKRAGVKSWAMSAPRSGRWTTPRSCSKRSLRVLRSSALQQPAATPSTP